MPQMMENPAFERDGGGGAGALRSVELGAVDQRNGVICTDLCRTQLQPPAEKPAPPSPWSPLKSVFLATVIGVLVIWVVIFATLSQLGLF